jgi:Mg-chelatase subunit ChlD
MNTGLHSPSERMRRWRLALGAGTDAACAVALNPLDVRIDHALGALYDSERTGGLGSSSPNVARWLGDIREFFPVSVVQVMQGDAMDRLKLNSLLLEPESLQNVVPDVALCATLLSLKNLVPANARATARLVVRKVVEDLERKLSNPLRQAIHGALNRSSKRKRPRHNEIDWHSTIKANLKHYQREYRTIIPETRIGFGRKQTALKDVVLLIDQSGSMAASVVYASVMGAVMASMRALRTSLVVFDTAVVDLTPQLADPVDVLFATQLGGGTDIAKALSYGRSLMTRPKDTIFILISDLIEGGATERMMAQVQGIVGAGARMIALLALSDEGAPSFDQEHAKLFAGLGIATFACTPNLFPELMANALQGRDLRDWAGAQGLALKG